MALNILIVDDVGYNRLILRRLLSREDCVVDESENAHQALKMLSQRRFDIVLCDLMMPDMSGLQLFDEINKSTFYDDQGVFDKPYFILCSAFMDEEVFEKAIQSGFQDALAKPIDRERLLNAVTKVAGLKNKARVSVNLEGAAAALLTELASLARTQPDEVITSLLTICRNTEFAEKLRSGMTIEDAMKSMMIAGATSPDSPPANH